MTSTTTMARIAASACILSIGFALSGQAHANNHQDRDPCSANSIVMSSVTPAQYSYTLGDPGHRDFRFTVSSGQVSTTGNCDSSKPPVWGNGGGTDPTVLPLNIEIETVEMNGEGVEASVDAAIRAALSVFSPAPTQLTPPGTGSQQFTLSFTNSADVPVGTYDLTIRVRPNATGVGVGNYRADFAIQVEEAQQLDTLPPTVNISAPSMGDSLRLNDALNVAFTAVDPPEGGAGTGVTAVRAEIASCDGGFNYALSSALSVDPALPVAADSTVTATTSVNPWLYVGNFTLTAEADDDADNTGSASVTFSAGTTIAPLPPISVPNRQFNDGSTVPVKFTITDGAGEFLPPMDGLVVRITAPGGDVQERVAGSGSTNVRWETDEYGNATQYITNYVVPSAGTFVVEVLVADVCGSPASQGSFTFVGASKGGKQR